MLPEIVRHFRGSDENRTALRFDDFGYCVPNSLSVTSVTFDSGQSGSARHPIDAKCDFRDFLILLITDSLLPNQTLPVELPEQL